MPMPLAGNTECGLRKDNVELGLYFPVLTTSPACPQSGDNYISNAEIKNVGIKSIYMEKGNVEPNVGWDGTPYDWSKGATEIQSNFVDTGAISFGLSNLIENSSFPTLNMDRWTPVFEEFDLGSKSENMLFNSRMLDNGKPWRGWGKTKGVTSYKKMVKLSTLPPNSDLHAGFEVMKATGEGDIQVGYTQDNVPVKPNTDYTMSAWVKKKSKTYDKPMTFFFQMGNSTHRWVGKNIDLSKKEIGEWIRISATFKTRDKEVSTSFYYGIDYEKFGHFEVAGMTLVQGRLGKDWSPSPGDVLDVANHPSNWIYSKTEPKDRSKIWGDTTVERTIVPKYWSGTGWDDYYMMMQARYGGEVKLIKQEAGNSVQIQKTHEGIVGLAQVVKLKEPLNNLDFINASFELEEKSKSQGMIARVEFFDKEMNFLSSGGISQRFSNIMVGKRRFDTGGTFQYRNADGIEAVFVRVTFAGSQTEGKINAAANKFKLEYGNKASSWTLHDTEVGLDLDAGELETPMIDGQVDKSHVIKEVAILRSSLGENLLSWEEVTRIKATSLKGAILHDYFVENGGYYRYALQPIMLDGTKGVITGFHDVVTTLEGFWLLGQDDMQFSFIYDGKITNINHRKPTGVIETIASQHPYIVRSSELDYRTYSFSGKLTYQQDTMNLLTSNTYTQAVSPQSTNPIGFVEIKYGDEKRLECQNDLAEMQDGMVMQRIWRHKLLDWMKDGKPKIIKSEAEGNMMVHVSDVQVTPVQTVYGLVADFSCTMTEIGKVDEETLQKFKLRKEVITHDDLRKSLLNENYKLM